MKRGYVLIATIAAFTTCLFVPTSGVAAGPPDVVCSQVTNTFTGTAHDLIVPDRRLLRRDRRDDHS